MLPGAEAIDAGSLLRDKAIRMRLSSLIFVLLLHGGCSSKEFTAAESCGSDPRICTTGQTCWPNREQTELVCLNSGAGDLGASCQLLPGAPTCGDRMICLAIEDGGTPVCTPLCSPTIPEAACPEGMNCKPFSANREQSQLYACEG
jgi:hypothetical protein